MLDCGSARGRGVQRVAFGARDSGGRQDSTCASCAGAAWFGATALDAWPNLSTMPGASHASWERGELPKVCRARPVGEHVS